jgi:hypothetical protein
MRVAADVADAAAAIKKPEGKEPSSHRFFWTRKSTSFDALPNDGKLPLRALPCA